MLKIKSLVFIAFLFAVNLVNAQSLTISNPVLTSPYQVTPGTVVTFEWDAFGSPPNSFFTSTAGAPNVQQNLPPDPSWTANSNFTGPVGGNYYLDLTITTDTWVWAGIGGFIGWQYSPVIYIQTISAYAITGSDSMICANNGSVVFTAPSGTGFTYQWHDASGPISGETGMTFTATSAGSYYCIVNDGVDNQTNTLTISDYVASFSGSVTGNQITMTADQTFSSYQWYERTGTGSATPIANATSNSYTATISSTETHYSFEGVSGSCTTASGEKTVIDTLFTAPTLTLYTSPNPQGFVCSGTPVSIKADGNSGMLSWYKNGNFSGSGTDSLNIWGAYQNGTYHVEASPVGWPNVSITSSNTAIVNILDLINPSLSLNSGASFYDNFCPSETLNIVLTDEGYNYTWYVHDTFNVYGPNDIVIVPPSMVYNHTFTNTVYITVVAEFNGCSTSTTKTLNSYADETISTSIDNYNQEYLCTDSTVNIEVASWMVADYTNFQWYQLSGTTWNAISGQTNATLTVTSPGEYRVEANPTACPTVTASSNSKTIYSYLDREPYIWAYANSMCEGDTTMLQLSAGANWYAKQWLESDISIGSGGYERNYIGMLTNSGQDTQEVTKFSSYQLSAKHISCPNGLKTKSNIVFIKPSLNPEIIQMNNHPSEPKHIIDWDSTNHIIGCQDEPVQLTLNNTAFDSIIWYVQGYAGDDDYAWGNQVHIGDTLDETMDAKWVTAVVQDANGCRGQSTPLLLDSRVFSSPAVTSYNNSELCDQGDSTLVHLSFTGTWISYEWSKDGTPIPNSNNDSLWAKEPGMYTISAVPADCPNFSYSSGLGPVVKYLYSEILEDDTLIYAMPELGFYTYQWYLDGDSIDGEPGREWVIYKANMQPGVYTVEVSNENCTKLSEGFTWDPTGINDPLFGELEIYPNPTNDVVYIQNVQPADVDFVIVTDLNGRQVIKENGLGSNQINVSELQTGMYILTIGLNDGQQKVVKLTKN